MKQILRLVHEIILSFWPQFLAVCIIGGLLALILLLALLRRWRSGSQPPAVTHEPSTGIHRHRGADIELQPGMQAKPVPSHHPQCLPCEGTGPISESAGDPVLFRHLL